MVGTTVSHHTFLSKLAEAEKGIVERAEDLNRTRTAALNFLPQDTP